MEINGNGKQGAQTKAHRRTLTQRKYDQANTTQLHFKLNNKTDADILEKLRSCDNMQGYFKQLIRADIKEANAKRKEK